MDTTNNELTAKCRFSKPNVEHCLLTWTIQNFSLMPKDSQKYITSPTFSLDSSSTSWYIHFYPYSMIEGKKSVKFCLFREMDDSETVAVTYRIGFEKYHVWFEEKRYALFNPGEDNSLQILFPEHLDNQHAFNANSLVIICEMYISLRAIDDFMSKIKLTIEYIDLLQLTSNFTEFAHKSEAIDVVIRVKDLRIRAHKAILAARSPVFARKLEDGCSSLDLLEEDYDHIFNILLYIYSGSLNMVGINRQLAIGLYECALRYTVSGLKELLLPTQISVCSTIQNEEIDFNWTIERFSGFDLKIGDYITSPPFNGGYQNTSVWFVDIYPHGSSEIPDSVGIFVKTTDECEELGINVSISILDDNKKELYVKHTDKPLLNNNFTFGFPRFIEKEKLTCTAELLRSDKLIIKCKMVFIGSTPSYKKTGLFLHLSLVNNTCYDLERLSMDFGKLLRNGTLSDAILLSGDTKFSVHKVILSARSPLFSTMILTNKEKDCVIDVSDIGAQVLQEMIFYAYTGKLRHFPSDFVVELYKAAVKYCMASLIDSCSLYLSSILNIECLCDVIILSQKHKDKRLMSRCLNYIYGNIGQILDSSEWAHMEETRSNLTKIILKWVSDRKLNDK